MRVRCAEVAATLMEHLCTHDWHGYTQGGGRWGDGEGVCTATVDGVSYCVEQGDRDCSSAVIDCWRQALYWTDYRGVLANATYTGNMRSVFTASGLFEWHPMGDGYIAQRGDVYLNEISHTAMCTSAVPDMLAEFSINEFGGIVGGQVGDQTGRESHVRSYYDFPWDGILAYNHGADVDEEEEDMTPEQAAQLGAVHSEITDQSDPTGRDKPGTMGFKIKWMAARQEEIQAGIDEIKQTLGLIADALKIGGTD